MPTIPIETTITFLWPPHEIKIPKGYPIKYRERFDMVKCDHFACVWGMGLAGRGTCPGIWWHHACPLFETEDELEAASREG